MNTQNNTELEKLTNEEIYILLAEQVKVLEKAQKEILQLERQNKYLIAENNEYRKKISVIKDSWFGKVLIWGYRALQKLKNLFKR